MEDHDDSVKSDHAGAKKATSDDVFGLDEVEDAHSFVLFHGLSPFCVVLKTQKTVRLKAAWQ